MLTYLLFIIGFAALIKGADWLVAGSSSLANRLGVSAFVIGLTIVAFGTSAPELIVNILASYQGNTDLAIANIVGSNIANILLILGISAVIYPLHVKRGTVWKEIPFALLAMVCVAIMANDMAIDGAAVSSLSRIDGLILVSFLVIFLYYIFGLARSSATAQSPLETIERHSFTRSWLMILGGIIGLVIGGKWIVDGAIAFATSFGVSEAMIGLTVVAIGTSLPELATSAVAAWKKNTDIAVGNVVGSNIFNVFWILGISSIIKPLPLSADLAVDVLIGVAVTALLFFALFINREQILKRSHGIIFILLYVAYTVYVIMRG